MASEVNVSLEDYIRTNKSKFNVKGKRPGGRRSGVRSPQKNGVNAGGVSKNKKPQPAKTGLNKKTNLANKGGGAAPAPTAIVDARLKIIAKTRSKISDARDRLNQRMRQKDARSRITPKGRTTGAVTKRPPPPSPLPRRTLTSSSNREIGRFRGVSNISRSNSRNGLSTRLPSRSSGGGSMAYMDIERVRDQGGLEESQVDWSSRMQALPRLQIHVPTSRSREPSRPPQLIPSLTHRTHMDLEGSWSRSSQKSSGSPLVYRSRDDLKSRLEPSRQDGYRIVVSNLQTSVTHEDIKELFEDVGVLIGSRVVRPGTAEVVYKNLDDAITAVDTYHNRQLDGQPMKCLLVKSCRSSTKSGREILPDISTVHHALFTK
ncbi:RNA recognition motif. (a.k.a. RRM, RBD, or RNP domain) [Nesidiocoris tenuis]|uniref:RNA recognition motif. (A.k.a. RRM, RBD, or RNP domain) n=1 Tax=Nesidiocoris tenuis TaxID=355587 RepID=A0ABN7BEA1_9HEMI|nr:RNA recognition motif. (a.k.a. RRM, RBD, or RNP domain) [Nesidiocoris tenuis]